MIAAGQKRPGCIPVVELVHGSLSSRNRRRRPDLAFQAAQLVIRGARI